MRIQLSMAALLVTFAAAGAGAQDEAVAAARSHARAARELARAYQGRGPEQTERFSKRVKMGRDGRLTVSNVSGDITVAGGPGDEVSIEAVKRARGDRDDLRSVDIEVEDRGGRVEVRTSYSGRNEHVAVDYTITVPSTAGVELNAVAGSLKVTDVKGIRAAQHRERLDQRVGLAPRGGGEKRLRIGDARRHRNRRRPQRRQRERLGDGERSEGARPGSRLGEWESDDYRRVLRPADGEIGERHRRVRRLAREERPLRHQFTLGIGAPEHPREHRVRPDREHLQRIRSAPISR